MEAGTLEKKIELLNFNEKLKVEGYVDALLGEKRISINKSEIKATRGFGGLKGKIWMSEDFNEPLDDFKDYM